MESNKILIVDSYQSEMARKLLGLIRSRNTHKAHIERWHHVPEQPYDIVLPVLRSAPPKWNAGIEDLINNHNGAAIIPVINEMDFGLFETLTTLQNGCSDFIVYPYRELEVFTRIGRFLKKPQMEEVENVKKRLSEKWALKKLVGKSKNFSYLIKKIPIVAKSDLDVLLQGETGTGKELFARAIHYQSPRRSGPFLALNCASLTPTLFENEMFGHEKEAFTDAKSFRPGVIKEAEGGTIFLDEVDTLERASQAKLLRFLEERAYKPLGSGKCIKADVRIIAASNSDLSLSVKASRFRQDLFYRLNVIALKLPPLRERQEDIPLLANHFLKKYAKRFGDKKLSPAVIKMFFLHTWQGNIRELENVIQQIMVMSPDQVIKPESLPFMKVEDDQQSWLVDTFQDSKQRHVEQFEKEYIYNILRQYNGNITQAAKAAGKDRRAFGRLVKKHQLHLQEEISTNHEPT